MPLWAHQHALTAISTWQTLVPRLNGWKYDSLIRFNRLQKSLYIQDRVMTLLPACFMETAHTSSWRALPRSGSEGRGVADRGGLLPQGQQNGAVHRCAHRCSASACAGLRTCQKGSRICELVAVCWCSLQHTPPPHAPVCGDSPSPCQLNQNMCCSFLAARFEPPGCFRITTMCLHSRQKHQQDGSHAGLCRCRPHTRQCEVPLAIHHACGLIMRANARGGADAVIFVPWDAPEVKIPPVQ